MVTTTIGSVITIFLEDGLPSGPKTVEIANWSGIAHAACRASVESFLDGKNIDSPCLYFLIGKEDGNNPKFYVGESEEVATRISSHVKNKAFWDEAIVFSSKDANLTKAHVRWLERAFYHDLLDAGRVSIQNDNTPCGSKLPDRDIAILQHYKQHVYTVLGVLGFVDIDKRIPPIMPRMPITIPVQVIPRPINEDDVFACIRSGSNARMLVLSDETYVVLAGSICLPDNQKYRNMASSWYLESVYRRRDAAMNDGKLRQLPDGKFELLEDQIFTSPSRASAFITGMSSNGLLDWKLHGMTLKDVRSLEADGNDDPEDPMDSFNIIVRGTTGDEAFLP